MQMFLRSVLALAFLGAFLFALPANAETSDDFNSVDLFLGDETDPNYITTMKPTSGEGNKYDCPQESNEKSWIGDNRQWGDVATWSVDLRTPGEIEKGAYTFRIWANATQGDVDDVQFRISIYIDHQAGSDTQLVDNALSDENGVDSEDEEATEFVIEFDIFNNSFDPEDENGNDQLRIDLEYSGGEDGSEPIIGGESTDQVVVIASSVKHPSGIGNMSINHYRVDFNEITVQDLDERVFVKTRVWSAFGEYDINSTGWVLGIFGESVGNQGLTADFGEKSSMNGSYEVTFYWYYNEANAISDTYHVYLQVMDIQGNAWEVVSDQNLYLVIHEFDVDDAIAPEDIQINNQTGMATVEAGSSFTIDIMVSASGEPKITYNPIPVTIIWVSGSTEIVLYDTVVFATPGATATTSFRHTFDEKGEYLIKVVLDRSNLVGEIDETNNVAEFLLVVSEPEKEDFIQSAVDSITGGGPASMFVLVAIASIALGAIFLRRGGSDADFEWEEDDEF
jgi:hypothetical protein